MLVVPGGLVAWRSLRHRTWRGRRLSEMPANMMTPTRFAQEAAEALEKKGVKVIA
ncbi:hypothetical protein MRX96_053643, partial [Rhipicephalus microplus]